MASSALNLWRVAEEHEVVVNLERPSRLRYRLDRPDSPWVELADFPQGSQLVKLPRADLIVQAHAYSGVWRYEGERRLLSSASHLDLHTSSSLNWSPLALLIGLLAVLAAWRRRPTSGGTALVRRIGGYELQEALGKGGAGFVYRAQSGPDSWVAVKLVSLENEARFQRECEIMAGLSHPQIVRLIHYGREGQWNYLVLEYVEGSTLRRRLPCPEMALDLMKQLVDAVWYLHRQDLLHLDLKPENVMVTEAGEVKLLDFGLARGQVQTRLTAHGSLVGTPAYLAPERFLEPNATATAAVDQYALGVIFFELLTGQLPYACEDPSLYVRAHQLPRPACGGELWLAEIAERMLSIDPQARFAHLGEVLDRLRSGPVANQETLL